MLYFHSAKFIFKTTSTGTGPVFPPQKRAPQWFNQLFTAIIWKRPFFTPIFVVATLLKSLMRYNPHKALFQSSFSFTEQQKPLPAVIAMAACRGAGMPVCLRGIYLKTL